VDYLIKPKEAKYGVFEIVPLCLCKAIYF